MNLEELRIIVFEKQKVPYFIEQHKDTKIAHVFDKDGMYTYVIMKDEMVEEALTPFDELTEGDLTLISSKIPQEQVDTIIGSSKKEREEIARLIANRPNLPPPRYRWRPDSHSIRK